MVAASLAPGSSGDSMRGARGRRQHEQRARRLAQDLVVGGRDARHVTS
jgi:hypothetical protein